MVVVVARRAGAMDRADRLARSLELEKAYVHDTYQEMYHPAHKTKPWPKVTRFLHDLEPGSLVCDIGEYRAQQRSESSANPFWKIIPLRESSRLGAVKRPGKIFPENGGR